MPVSTVIAQLISIMNQMYEVPATKTLPLCFRHKPQKNLVTLQRQTVTKSLILLITEFRNGLTWKHNPQGAKAVVLWGCFTLISTLFVSLRLYARFFKLRNHGLEDYAIFVALLASIGYTAIIKYERRNGLGMHY